MTRLYPSTVLLVALLLALATNAHPTPKLPSLWSFMSSSSPLPATDSSHNDGRLTSLSSLFHHFSLVGHRVVPPVAAEDKEPPKKETKSVLDTLAGDHRFSKLVHVLGKAGGNLKDDLGEEHITVFAPTNDAFQKLGDKHFDEDTMRKILKYHISKNKELQYKHSFYDGQIIETDLHEEMLNNRPQVIRVIKIDNVVKLNLYSTIHESHIKATNGIIHVIDNLLIPPTNAFDSLSVLPIEFSTTVLAIQLVKLEKALQEASAMTFFVPTNEAWQALGHQKLMELFSPAKREQLRFLIMYHASPKLYYSRDLHPQMVDGDHHKHKDDDDEPPRPGHRHIKLPSLAGSAQLDIEAHFGGEHRRRVLIKVNGHGVWLQDIPVQNGVVNVIDHVLYPGDTGDDSDDDAE
ncbi:hypothetical protein RI367_001107 [Sorochytrium milnesiophthora]